MTSFSFKPLKQPFPSWRGPFSPARGTQSGFRVHARRVGAWVEEGLYTRTFWPFVDSSDSCMLTNIVINNWGGGRLLFLPNGLIVKPLQNLDEVGRRVVIGSFSGSIQLIKPQGSIFDFANPGNLKPGDWWPGPMTTGLECIIDETGTLTCTWYHPTPSGKEEITRQLRGPDPTLAAGFRKARPTDFAGRVRITSSGHIITNRQDRYGSWAAYYVGWINTRNK